MYALLIELLRKVVRKFWPKGPGKVRHLEIDMANRRLTWTLPNVSMRQAEISHTTISFRVDPSFPWTKQADVPAGGVQELLFSDVNPGTFYYQAVVVDVEGQEGPPAETSAFTQFEPPGSVSNFKATDEV